MLRRVIIAALVLTASVAQADDADDDSQVVVVNAAPRLGDTGQIERLRQRAR